MKKLPSTYCVNPAGKFLGMSPRSWGLAQGLHRLTETRRRASVPEMSEGRSKYRSLAPGREPSGVSAEKQGPTTRNLWAPVQLSESLALRTLASACVFAPRWTVAVVLYTHAQSQTVNSGTGRSSSEGAEFRRSTRETVRERCSRTISYAHCWRSVFTSQ